MIAIFDKVMWLYIAAVIICIYGFGLFVWWWAKMKDASAVYIYVTLLFAGEIFNYSIQFWSRYLRVTGCSFEYTLFVNSPLWFIRLFIPVACLLAIIIHMTYRVIKNKDK